VRFAFSLANTGEDISNQPVVQDADILHLHWINQGFLSLDSLRKLFQLNKPVVWTLHDMWTFTGGCHYAGSCLNYEQECHHCPFLKRPSAHDLAYQLFQRKLRLYKQIYPQKIVFVTCSQWLADKAKISRLLQNFPIVSIPNAIDPKSFYPLDKTQARNKIGLPLDKKLILFGAGNIFDKRKGIEYLRKALDLIVRQHPELAEQIELVIFGKSKQPVENLFPFKIHNLGILRTEDSLLNLYNSCDVFALPSLEDNLPNTVMESMACGVPVVAFRTGGIPEMIDHLKNGFLAEYLSSSSLAEGIRFILTSELTKEMQIHAREKIEKEYSPAAIAERYRNIYSQVYSSTKH
jgi:glycosyltransferase involved in cell wall biosynthesis